MTGAMVGGTDDGIGRWLTYDELAQMRGIQRIGAVRLAKRQGWRRQPGNDGKARVMVPTDALAPVRGTRPSPDGANGTNAGDPTIDPTGGPDGGRHLAAAFELALTTIREAHAGEVTALRGQLAAAEGRAEQARAEAVAAQGRAGALAREQRSWWEQGRLRRVLAAWRGTGG